MTLHRPHSPFLRTGLARSGLILLLYLAVLATLPAQVRVGDAFPSLSEAKLSSGPLPDLKGKVVLVDFWASWCAPCKASFDAYARLNAAFAAKGLVIIAVSVDQDAEAYGAFVKKHAPPFFVALDKEHLLVGRTQVPTMPTSYLIDRSGRVCAVHSGYHGGDTEAAIRSEVETQLGKDSP